MIRVVLVDDQALFRAGVRMLVGSQPDLEVVGEAGDGQTALDLIADVRPDVVLLDLRMPVLDGIGTLRGLRAAEHRPPVLVLTTFDDDDEVLAALFEVDELLGAEVEAGLLFGGGVDGEDAQAFGDGVLDCWIMGVG